MKTENESFNYTDTYPEKVGGDRFDASILPDELTVKPGMIENCIALPYSTCLIDHSGRQFVCFHEKCSEQNSCFKNELAEDTFSFQALRIHPDDKVLLCEKIFPDILRFMEHIPLEELSEYRFSFNHRYIRKDGAISQFLQEGTLSIPEDNHIPVLNLKVFTEIGDFKTDDTMILSIFRYSSEQGYQKVSTKVYANTDNSLISQREREIIKLCLEGLSSKMIAEKLNISIHTVKNHKRNCMEKTLTHNITELINLCIKSHWI